MHDLQIYCCQCFSFFFFVYCHGGEKEEENIACIQQ